MSKTLFVILTVAYFAFCLFGIRNLPVVMLWGWCPSHMFGYFGTAPIISLIWWAYFKKFFDKQKNL